MSSDPTHKTGPDSICQNILQTYRDSSFSPDTLTKNEIVAKWLDNKKRRTLSKPAVFIGTGTCGLGAGAGKTLRAIEQYIKTNNLDMDIVEVGCIGLCVEEPLV
jgi:NADH:ubiquinone oxidoreductase subunit E